VVFLGDCGSHFLGYLIAMLVFMTSTSLAGQGRSMMAFGILLMPFLFDVTLTLVRRTLAGKKIWEAHREHLYQRLMICGRSHMSVLRICTVTYLACGGLAVACVLAETAWGRAGCLALSIAVMAVYTGFVRHNEDRRNRCEAATG
jgi:UDP-N-acetylmuramyl pentapeptide phosphotransferase/UDP-N-acetylglucosamine-1-phosphate transferase